MDYEKVSEMISIYIEKKRGSSSLGKFWLNSFQISPSPEKTT